MITTTTTSLTGQEILDKYVELKNQMDLLEKQIEDLKPAVVNYLSNNEKIETPLYQASIGMRTTYNYPEHIRDMEDKVKLMKNRSLSDGFATVKSTSIYPIIKIKF